MPLFWALLAAAVVAAGDHQGVTLQCRNVQPCAVNGSLLLTSADDASRKRRLPIAHGVARFDDRDATRWLAELEADGYWMPAQMVPASAHSLDVWRTGTARGRFVVDLKDKTGTPKQAEISLEPPPDAKQPLFPRNTSFRFSVAPDGSWACPLPAVPLDFAVRATGYTPQYVFNARISPAGALDLGSVMLRRGGSVVAWLDRKTVQQLSGPARARLVRMVLPVPSSVTQQLSRPVAEASFQGNGAVQLQNVPAGRYTLEVRAKGFATTRIRDIEVYDGRESSLRRAIALEPPLNVRLTLSPATGPAGVLWRVRMWSEDQFSGSGEIVERIADASGAAEFRDQGAGRYTVEIKDDRQNRYASRHLVFTNDFDAQQTIDIPVTRVHGTVRLGSDAIPAALLFGGRSGAERVATRADQEGAFATLLPRPGKWTVDVEEPGHGVKAIAEVTVTDDESVTIQLPDTDVSGFVISPDGKRVTAATVRLQSTLSVITMRTGADGTFGFRGVQPGLVRIAASGKGTQHTRLVTVPVSEGKPVENVELKLESERTISGLVTARGQPVTGARVAAYPFVAGGAEQVTAVSDTTGQFEMKVPEAASDIVVMIAAAGRAFQAFRFPIASDAERFDLAPVGGSLHVEFPPGTTRTAVAVDGIPLPPPDLLQWAVANGGTVAKGIWEIPNLAPGNYRVCSGRAGSADSCREGLLMPAGRLDLSPN